jgi:hypothetical protein
MQPDIALAIPRPARIVTAPIVAEAEGHDADPELAPKLHHRNSAVLIIEE